MKPIAFRIRDFRSIIDSGVVPLSGDNITVLAGQNEAGKTAILLALRDFDRPPGEPPLTPEFMPEANFDARPRVAVQFVFEPQDLGSLASDVDFPELIERLQATEKIWIERDLLAAEFSLGTEVDAIWTSAESDRAARLLAVAASPGDAASEAEDAEDDDDNAESEDADDSAESEDDEGEDGADDDATSSPASPPTRAAVAAEMQGLWPLFVYFDTFEDTLPRQVDVDALLGQSKKGAPSVPQSVRDFIALAGVDPAKVKELADQDKALGNYLQSRGALITGDFLTYWQQRVDGEQHINLQVRHVRDAAGTPKLSFYVRDKVDQFPEQRSKGFLWFLSFFLRLAAERKHDPNRKRLLLIDEPGSYLHARAQRDVLHLFESRIAPDEAIIYTSHSPFLIPPHTLHRIRVVMKSAANGTRVYDRLTHPDLRGPDLADTLTPVTQAIGIDITQALTFTRHRNLLVEGITDHIYLVTWGRLFATQLLEQINVFPGFGATTLPTFASLFIGWGLPFGVLLDRDHEGVKTKERLTKELLIPEARIAHPKDALGIEDVFSAEDFRALLTALDTSLTLAPTESPSAAIKRQSVDKVILARTYAERVARGETDLTKKTLDRIQRLLPDIDTVTTA